MSKVCPADLRSRRALGTITDTAVPAKRAAVRPKAQEGEMDVLGLAGGGGGGGGFSWVWLIGVVVLMLAGIGLNRFFRRRR